MCRASERYGGDRLWGALNVESKILKSIRYLTGSQWRLKRIWVMCWSLEVQIKTQAARLCTNFTYFIKCTTYRLMCSSGTSGTKYLLLNHNICSCLKNSFLTSTRMRYVWMYCSEHAVSMKPVSKQTCSLTLLLLQRTDKYCLMLLQSWMCASYTRSISIHATMCVPW